MSEQRTPNPGGSRLEKKTKKTRTRKERIRLRIIIALVVVLALLIGLFALYRSWAKKPPVDPVTPSQSATGDMMATSGPEMGGDRKEDFYTFLVVGRDTGGGGNTDTAGTPAAAAIPTPSFWPPTTWPTRSSTS